MSEKILASGINVKDQQTDTNAGQKLTNNFENINFSIDTKATPCIIAGVEENQVSSQVNFITMIKDFYGNNRLCVDTGISTSNLFYYSGQLNDTQSIIFSNYGLPENATLFVLGVTYYNSDAFAHDCAIWDTFNTGHKTFCSTTLTSKEKEKFTGGVMFSVKNKFYFYTGGFGVAQVNIWGYWALV